MSKDLVVGQVYKLAGRLAEEGEAYKSTDALLKLAKIRGWVGNEPDSLWDVFNDLSHKDIQELKHKIYVQVVKMVVASAVNEDGEQIYPRTWNHEFIDLPIVDKNKQNAPSISSEIMTGLAAWNEKRERMLFILRRSRSENK